MAIDIRDLASIIRVGTVTDVDLVHYKVRVMYQDRGYTSNWLKVLDNRPFIPNYNVPQRTEYAAGGSGDAAYASHSHNLVIKQWMPSVGATVLVLYVPAKNSDGYVLGGMQ